MDYNRFLGRENVYIDLKNDLEYIKGKRVLITGAGGTIGSELSRQLLFGGAKRLYLFNHSENTLFDLLRKLEEEIEINNIKDAILVPVIGELQDAEYMEYIIEKLKPDVVFHAAAHKHVELSEDNPIETLKNNAFGTRNIVRACERFNVPKFILISTDKAVNPIGIYGVSKALAEEIVINQKTKNNFLAVRFGNVLGSSGSVFHIFRKKILEGKPLPITDPKVTRYFMSIEEAVSLIIKIGSNGNGSGLYMLDMGKQLLIEELAKLMMEDLNKLTTITYTGLKRGEKIKEELWDANNECPFDTILHEKIKRIEKVTKIENIEKILDELFPVCYFVNFKSRLFRSKTEARNILKPIFPTLKTLDNITER